MKNLLKYRVSLKEKLKCYYPKKYAEKVAELAQEKEPKIGVKTVYNYFAGQNHEYSAIIIDASIRLIREAKKQEKNLLDNLEKVLDEYEN